MKRLPLIINIVLFVALCVLTSYWVLQIFKPKPRPIVAPMSAEVLEPAMGQWGNLFGVNTVIENAPSNYQLKGVIVAAKAKDSAAIIVVEGKPTYSIGIGKELSPGVQLQEVHTTHIIVSENGIPKQIDLPQNSVNTDGIIPGVLPMKKK